MRIECEFCQHVQETESAKAGKFIQCGNCQELCRVPLERIAKSMTFDDFAIDECIGSGGMGVVYRARQLSLDRAVAVKFLNVDFSANEKFVSGFLKEARLAASLNHPNIVQAYAAGESDGIYYFAMEYVKGRTVAEILRDEGRLDEEKALEIALRTTQALGEAWRRKEMIHRDIKPDNIMISDEGTVKLMDLGLSCTHAESEADGDDQVVGSPHFICPEQIMGELMDIRGDLYSLGASLYQMLSGCMPFTGNDAQEILKHHLGTTAQSLDAMDVGISSKAASIVERLMRKLPGERYQNCLELEEDLKKALASIRKVRSGVKVMRHSSVPNSRGSQRSSSQNRPSRPLKKQSENKSNKMWVMVAILTLILTAGGVIAALIKPSNNRETMVAEAQPEGIADSNTTSRMGDVLLGESVAEKASLPKALEQKALPAKEVIRDYWIAYYSEKAPGRDWKEKDFSSKSWEKIRLPVGYGYEECRSLLDYGNDEDNKPIAAFFRREFELEKLEDYSAKVRFDDGVVVYINNRPVFKRHLSSSPDFDELADTTVKGSMEHAFLDFEIDSSFFVEGKNVIAVEVHQVKAQSSDLIFDIEIKDSSGSWVFL